MFDPKSDYALNKKEPDAIVYIDAAGTLTRLTLADFSSPEEFQRWKAWSDESYHQIENAEIAFSKHILSLHGLSEKTTAVQSPEDTLMETLEQQEREEMRRLLMDGLDNCLTRPQRRRLWLYCVDRLTVRQIAEAENVKHQIKRKIASVKAFCNHLEYEGLVNENPFSRLRLKLNPPLILPRTLSLSAIETILESAYQAKREAKTKEHRNTVVRDIAVLELLFATGVRVSELCALQYGDVRLDEGVVKIIGKGAKERYVQIANPDVLAVLHCYAETFQKDMEQAGTFFVNRCHRPLSDQSVRSIINKYSKLAGVENHITPHMFRHSFATLLLEEGVDIRYIQRLLGHSSIVTTQIYTHVASKKQRDILFKKHPRNKIHSI